MSSPVVMACCGDVETTFSSFVRCYAFSTFDFIDASVEVSGVTALLSFFDLLF